MDTLIQPALTNIAKQSLIQSIYNAHVQQALAESAKQALIHHLTKASPSISSPNPSILSDALAASAKQALVTLISKSSVPTSPNPSILSDALAASAKQALVDLISKSSVPTSPNPSILSDALAASAKQALVDLLSAPPPVECPDTAATIASVENDKFIDLRKLSALLQFDNATIEIKFVIDPAFDLTQAADLEKAYQPPYKFHETITFVDKAPNHQDIKYDPEKDLDSLIQLSYYTDKGVEPGENRNLENEIKQSIDHLVCRIGGQSKDHVKKTHVKNVLTATNNRLSEILKQKAKDALLAQIGTPSMLAIKKALAESAKAALLKELRPETGLQRHLEKLAKDHLLDHLRHPNKMAVLNRLTQAAKDKLIDMLQNHKQYRAQSILKRALVRHMVGKARERRRRMEELKHRLAELAKERLKYALLHPKETQIQTALEEAAKNALRTAILEKAQEIQKYPVAETLRERAKEALITEIQTAHKRNQENQKRNQENQKAVEKALREAAIKALKYYLSDEYKLKTILEEEAKRRLVDTLYASKLLAEWKHLISRFAFDGNVLKQNSEEIVRVLGDKARDALLVEVLAEKERIAEEAEAKRKREEEERLALERIAKEEEDERIKAEEVRIKAEADLLSRNQALVQAAAENAARNALVKELEKANLEWKAQNTERVNDALLAASKTALMEKLQEIRQKAAMFLQSCTQLIGRFVYDGTNERKQIQENAEKITTILEGKSKEALVGKLNETMKNAEKLTAILKDKSTKWLTKHLNETMQEQKRRVQTAAEQMVEASIKQAKQIVQESAQMAQEEDRTRKQEIQKAKEEKKRALETQLLNAIHGSALTELRKLIQANSPQEVAVKKLHEMKRWIARFKTK